VYSTLQPELVKEQAQREEVDPAFASQHPKEHLKHEQQAAEAQRDTAISRAMAQDFKEAGQQITQGGGFAWGIRKAIFGSKEDTVAADAPGGSERMSMAQQNDDPNDEEKK
jgi:guanyl-specific ribonuclease Sa